MQPRANQQDHVSAAAAAASCFSSSGSRAARTAVHCAGGQHSLVMREVSTVLLNFDL